MLISGRHLLLATALTLSALAVVCSAAPAADTPVASVWQKHEFRYRHMGFTSTYSCDGLAAKLRLLLLAAGARTDLKVVASGCTAGFGHPDRFAGADLTFYTLQPAPKDTPTPTGERVQGQWRPVHIQSHSPSDVQAGDCELVEQFRDQLLPLFTTRALKDQTRCVPHQETLGSPSLDFEALRQMPSAAAAPAR